MSKIPECDRCQFYARTLYVICALHPSGPEGETCLDFRDDSSEKREPLWEPEGASYYNGELTLYKPRLTREQQLWLLDNHPFFTGCCPECSFRFDPNNPPQVHWDCPGCGWMDDAIH